MANPELTEEELLYLQSLPDEQIPNAVRYDVPEAPVNPIKAAARQLVLDGIDAFRIRGGETPASHPFSWKDITNAFGGDSKAETPIAPPSNEGPANIPIRQPKPTLLPNAVPGDVKASFASNPGEKPVQASSREQVKAMPLETPVIPMTSTPGITSNVGEINQSTLDNPYPDISPQNMKKLKEPPKEEPESTFTSRVMPSSPIDRSRLDKIEQAYNDQQKALDDAAAIGQQKAVEEQAFFAEQEKLSRERAAEQKKILERQAKEFHNAMTDLKYYQANIDPERFWNSKSTAEKIGIGIGYILSGIGSGVNKGPNSAVALLQQQIDRDIDSQWKNVGAEANTLSMLLSRFGDEHQALAAARVLANDVIQDQLKYMASKWQGEQGKINADGAIAQLEIAKQKDMLSLESAMANRSSGIAGQIMTRVPERQRTMAFKELGEKDALMRGVKSIGESYDIVRNTAVLDALPFTESKAKVDAAQSSVMSIIQSFWKGPMSDEDLKRMQGLLPMRTDTPAQTDAKKKQMLNFIKSRAPATPVLDAFGIDTNVEEKPKEQTRRPKSSKELLNKVKDVGFRGTIDRATDEAYQRTGVPKELLLSMIDAESGFNPNLKSEKGAVGLAQFMPETAKQYNVDPKNPVQSILGMALYMRDLTRKYKGDYGLAVRAYNAGPANVDKVLKSGSRKFSDENESYVNKILSNAGGKDGDLLRGFEPQN